MPKSIRFIMGLIGGMIGLYLISLLPYVSSSTSNQGEEPYVNVYNWYGLLPEDVLHEFTQITGIKVRYDLFDSNEMLEAKLFAGHSGFDVVFPSAAPYVARQIEANIYLPLDKSKLSNSIHLDPTIAEKIQSIDPGLTFCIPFYWGTFGFTYVEEKIKALLPNAPVNSYRMLFDPEVVKHFTQAGVSLLEEAIDVYPAMLAYLGYDSQSTSPEELAHAQDQLMKIRPYLFGFSGSRFTQQLVAGDTCIAQSWSGEAQLAQSRADEVGKKIHIRYVLPLEGGIIWSEVMAIPRDAPHPQNAHAFINFLLRPDISARVMNHTKLAVANRTGLQKVEISLREDKNFWPPEDVLKNFRLDKTQSVAYERLRTGYWIQFRLGRRTSNDQSLSFKKDE